MSYKKYKIIYRLLIILLVINLSAAAQVGQNLNLPQAILMSIKSSKELRISASKIDEANAMLQMAKDSRLPDFNFSASYLRLGAANIDLKKSGNGNSNSGAGVNPSQAVYGIANLSLPLYAGGRIQYGIESAKYLQQATTLDAQNDRDVIALNTIKAYINLYKAQESVAMVKAALNSSLSRDSVLTNLEKNGIIARNDLLKSQLQTSNIELSVLDAENNFNLAMVNINLLLGQQENSIIQIDSSFLTTELIIKPFAYYQSLALQNRKDIQAIVFRKKASVTTIKSARAEACPVLSVTGGYIAAHIPEVITITNALNLGIGVQYNLASLWKKNTKLLQAKARETQLAASQEILEDAVLLQVNQDYQNYMLSKKKIEVYQKAVAQAAENFRITNNKFNNSLATVPDLLEADVALLQSKLNLQTSKADAVTTYYKLLLTTGVFNY